MWRLKTEYTLSHFKIRYDITAHFMPHSCSPCRVSTKLWTTYETVSPMQQLHEDYAFQTCHYVRASLWRQLKLLSLPLLQPLLTWRAEQESRESWIVATVLRLDRNLCLVDKNAIEIIGCMWAHRDNIFTSLHMHSEQGWEGCGQKPWVKTV